MAQQIIQHYDALTSRLELAPVLAGAVHDSARTNDEGGLVRANYLIAYVPAPEAIVSGRFTAIATYDSELSFIVDLKAVGTSARMAGAVFDAALGQLVGHRLIVPGRDCTPITVDDQRRIEPDRTVKPPLFVGTASIAFISRPA
jgi:hypothetical protein